jgi:hypothetical protein
VRCRVILFGAEQFTGRTQNDAKAPGRSTSAAHLTNNPFLRKTDAQTRPQDSPSVFFSHLHTRLKQCCIALANLSETSSSRKRNYLYGNTIKLRTGASMVTLHEARFRSANLCSYDKA